MFAGAHFHIIPSDFYPSPWQYTWMLSGVVSLIGLNALAKNKKEMLSLHNLGLTIFGFGGIFFGFTSQYSSHQRYIASGETKRIADIPLHYIWVLVLALNVINYLATYIYSIRLKAAWNVRKTRWNILVFIINSICAFDFDKNQFQFQDGLVFLFYWNDL